MQNDFMEPSGSAGTPQVTQFAFAATENQPEVRVVLSMCSECNRMRTNVHDELGCEHYGNILSLLENENNLDQNEFAIFRKFESQLVVADAGYTIGKHFRPPRSRSTPMGKKDDDPYFTFDYQSQPPQILTNISADSNRPSFNMAYQSTIHEIWHGIDFLIGQHIRSKRNFVSYHNKLFKTIQQDVKERLNISKKTRKIFYEEFEKEVSALKEPYKEWVEDINRRKREHNIAKGRIVRIDHDIELPRYASQSEQDRLRNEKIGLEQRIQILTEEIESYEQRDGHRNRLSEYFYPCDILEGECYANKHRDIFRSPLAPRNPEYWTGRFGRMNLSLEFLRR